MLSSSGEWSLSVGGSVLVAASAVGGGAGTLPADEGKLLPAPPLALFLALLLGVTRRFFAAFSNFKFLASMEGAAPLLVVGVLGGAAAASVSVVAGSKGAVTKYMSEFGVVS